MPQKRYIRLQVTLLTVLYLGFLVLILTVFKQQYLGFHDQIFRKSQTNLEVLHAVKKIEVSLAVYERGYANYLANGGQKWLEHLGEAKSVIAEQLAYLEKFNFKEIDDWVVVQEFKPEDASEKLAAVLEGYQEGRFDSDHFQRLFYLLRFNINHYIQTTEVDLKKSDAAGGTLAMSDATVKLENLLVESAGQVRSIYTGLFWDHAAVTNREYDRDSLRFFIGVIVGSTLLFLFAIAIFLQLFSYMRRFQSRQERLVMLGAQNTITGLFHIDATRLLVTSEMERVRRLGHLHTFLLFRFGPLEAVKAQLGPLYADKLVFTLVGQIKRYFRPGEAIYQTDTNEVLLTFVAPDHKRLLKRCQAFTKSCEKMAFLKPLAKEQLQLQVEFAAAVVGVHGTSFDPVLQSARARLSTSIKGLFDFTEVVAAAPEKVEMASTVPEAAPEPAVSQAAAEAIALAEAEADRADMSDLGRMAVSPVQEPLAGERVLDERQVAAHSFAQNPLSDHFESESGVAAPTEPDRDVLGSAPADASMKDPEEITADGIVPPADLPDVVAAMMQDAGDEPAFLDGAGTPVTEIDPSWRADIPATNFPDNVARLSDAPQAEPIAQESDTVSVNDIEVVEGESEDVILVDFDREKSDLAERFRRRIKTQGRKGT